MTIVFQSAPSQRPQWVEQCLQSVEQWAQQQGFNYVLIGDELFDLLPQGYRGKVDGRGAILADLGRLLLIQDHLQKKGGQAIWLDADTLCVDPLWSPPADLHSFFGEECWIQQDEHGKWRQFITPHNAFLGFSASSPILPFLTHITESIINRADKDHIAPQMVGPKLLKALHSLAQFHLIPAAGALSPALIAELTSTPAEAVMTYKKVGREPLAMVNLCASLAATTEDDTQRELLINDPSLLKSLID